MKRPTELASCAANLALPLLDWNRWEENIQALVRPLSLGQLEASCGLVKRLEDQLRKGLEIAQKIEHELIAEQGSRSIGRERHGRPAAG